MRLPRFRRADPAAPRPSVQIRGFSETPDFTGRRAFLDHHVFVHTHIPKTAGSTLAAGLAGIVGGVETLDLRLRGRVRLTDLTRPERDALRLVSGHFDYGVHRHLARAPLYVAAVRDPVARAVSHYRFLRGSPRHGAHARAMASDFAGFWQDEPVHNAQARVLTGQSRGDPLDEALLWQRLTGSYFLVIPQERVTRTLQRLRAAFGLPHMRLARQNVAETAEVDVPPDLQARIQAADAIDAALHARVLEEHDARLDEACNFIAQSCLRPL